MVSGNGQTRRILPAVLIAGAIAVGLFAAPQHATNHARVLMRDALQPGLLALDKSLTQSKCVIHHWLADGPTDSRAAQTATTEKEPRSLRQLRVENALLQQKLRQAARLGTAPYRARPSAPLLIADLLEARVLGQESVGLWRGGWLLNRGRDASLVESDLVLQDDTPLVDAGAADRLEPGFPVFAGRTVLGRIRHVGRWSSSLEAITARTFRGHAQLIRKTPNGFVFGATGVIKGTGKPFCRLDMIAATEPVAVGDGVYTISDGGVFPYPMYYGKVRRASLISGASHWNIDVEPVIGTARPRTVLVLRRRLNPKQAPPPTPLQQPQRAGADAID